MSGESAGLRLLLVGDGPDRPSLERLANQLAVADRVIFAGFQSDVTPFYRLMDVFALVSRNESFGLAVVEAMFARLPTVCTGVGGMRDVVEPGRSGVLVDVGDIDGMATALSRFLACPAQRREFGERGRERALEEFSAERYVTRVGALYRELASNA